ncbi:hypothetical protein HanIR_Chr11g0542981 [Helianthus annuus]|nr:hypothetical protein HanIR_Chr11g0542981 [Helianthus annuus]
MPFVTGRNDVPTTVTSGAVAKIDYSTTASSLALPDARKLGLHPPKGTTV